MSLPSLMAAGADDIFRGYLQSEYIIDAGRLVRLRAGGYERAIDRTLASLSNLSRRDPTYLRYEIAPRVRESLNAARRLNADEPTGARYIPWAPGGAVTPSWGYDYLVRGRVQAQGGTGRRDFLVVVSSNTALSKDDIDAQAAELAERGAYTRDYRGRVAGIDSSYTVAYSVVSAYRSPRW